MNIQKQISNILFPTDFSPLSENALRTAVAMCQRQAATLHLLHIVEVQFVAPPAGAMSTGVFVLSGMETIAQEKLTTLANTIKQDYDVKIETHLAKGYPAGMITEKAGLLGCDLIIMGTHGASGIREFFIGSNAYAVIKKSMVPVLTVPGTATFTVFKKILFPVRAVAGVMDKLHFIQPVIEKNNAQMMIAALSLPDEIPDRQELDYNIARLSATLKSVKKKFRMVYYVCHNYAKKVLELASKTRADLIVINASLDYKWTQFFVGPYAQQVVNHAKIPVLSMGMQEGLLQSVPSVNQSADNVQPKHVV